MATARHTPLAESRPAAAASFNGAAVAATSPRQSDRHHVVDPRAADEEAEDQANDQVGADARVAALARGLDPPSLAAFALFDAEDFVADQAAPLPLRNLTTPRQ